MTEQKLSRELTARLSAIVKHNGGEEAIVPAVQTSLVSHFGGVERVPLNYLPTMIRVHLRSELVEAMGLGESPASPEPSGSDSEGHPETGIRPSDVLGDLSPDLRLQAYRRQQAGKSVDDLVERSSDADQTHLALAPLERLKQARRAQGTAH